MTEEIRSNVPVYFSIKMIPTCLLLGLALIVPCRAQISDTVLKQLSSDEFHARKTAEEELTDWAFNNRDAAYDTLYRYSREHGDAEVRVRCLAILRKLVSDIYNSEGEGYVGIRMMDATVRLPGEEDLEIAVLQVVEIMPDSPAVEGGLMVGDSILSLEHDGWKQLPATDDFRNRIKSIKPRSLVTLQVLRGKEMIDVKVRLARRPAAAENPFELPDQERINAMEEALREEYFKKWLLDRKNGR